MFGSVAFLRIGTRRPATELSSSFSRQFEFVNNLSLTQLDCSGSYSLAHDRLPHIAGPWVNFQVDDVGDPNRSGWQILSAVSHRVERIELRCRWVLPIIETPVARCMQSNDCVVCELPRSCPRDLLCFSRRCLCLPSGERRDENSKKKDHGNSPPRHRVR